MRQQISQAKLWEVMEEVVECLESLDRRITQLEIKNGIRNSVENTKACCIENSTA